MKKLLICAVMILIVTTAIHAQETTGCENGEHQIEETVTFHVYGEKYDWEIQEVCNAKGSEVPVPPWKSHYHTFYKVYTQKFYYHVLDKCVTCGKVFHEANTTILEDKWIQSSWQRKRRHK